MINVIHKVDLVGLEVFEVQAHFGQSGLLLASLDMYPVLHCSAVLDFTQSHPCLSNVLGGLISIHLHDWRNPVLLHDFRSSLLRGTCIIPSPGIKQFSLATSTPRSLVR